MVNWGRPVTFYNVCCSQAAEEEWAESTCGWGHGPCLSVSRDGGGDSVVKNVIAQLIKMSSCRKIPLLASVEGLQLLYCSSSSTVGAWVRRRSGGDLVNDI